MRLLINSYSYPNKNNEVLKKHPSSGVFVFLDLKKSIFLLYCSWFLPSFYEFYDTTYFHRRYYFLYFWHSSGGRKTGYRSRYSHPKYSYRSFFRWTYTSWMSSMTCKNSHGWEYFPYTRTSFCTNPIYSRSSSWGFDWWTDV